MNDLGRLHHALVVEDDTRMAALLQRMLTRNGFVVTVALDGVDGERVWAAARFDLVVLDVMLPYRDGLELCAARRSAGDRTPVIVTTARDEPTTRARAMAAGANAYLTKPFAFAEFVRQAQELANRGGGGSPASERAAG